jgi:hypothetical protein
VALWDIPAHLRLSASLPGSQQRDANGMRSDFNREELLARSELASHPHGRSSCRQFSNQPWKDVAALQVGSNRSALKHPIRVAEASTSLRRVCLAMQAVVANRPFQAPNPKNKCGTPPPLSQTSSRRSREDAIRRARGKFWELEDSAAAMTTRRRQRVLADLSMTAQLLIFYDYRVN